MNGLDNAVITEVLALTNKDFGICEIPVKENLLLRFIFKKINKDNKEKFS